MSKSNLRKITVDSTKCNTDSRRPSVFERLGTKPANSTTIQNTTDYCRNWALNGNCSYGKNCKYANTHTLISPSKRAKKDNAIPSTTPLVEDPFKRITSKIVKKASHSPDLNLEEWNQTDLEYEDEKVLERRRQLLQRELELQMKKDKEVHGKEKTKIKKKTMSSSSSSQTSSTSSTSSSSTSEDSSSSSSDSRKKIKKVKTKRQHSASGDYEEDKERRRKSKLKRLGAKTEKSANRKKRKIEPNSIKKDNIIRSVKKPFTSTTGTRKHAENPRIRSSRSPTVQSASTTAPSTPIVAVGTSTSNPHHIVTNKSRERNRSESPKGSKIKEVEKDSRHYKKVRDDEGLTKETFKTKTIDKAKEPEKEKARSIEDAKRTDDKLKLKCKEKERRSRTPPLIDRSKHQHLKDNMSTKSRRSRTPEKISLRPSKRESTPPKHPDRQISASSSGRSRELEKKDPHKNNRSKEREEVRKPELNKSRIISNQDENNHRRSVKDFDEKNFVEDKVRQKSRERRDKDHAKEERVPYSRGGNRDFREKEKEEIQDRTRERQRERDRERDRERERDRDRDRDRDNRDRDRDRDREKETLKTRDRDSSTIVSSTPLTLPDKRYGRDKERAPIRENPFEKGVTRDRRNEKDNRERSETKPLIERDKNSTQRFDNRYERGIPDKELSSRKGINDSPRDRFPRERSLDKGPPPLPQPPPPPPPLPPGAPSSTSGSASLASLPSSRSDHPIDRDGAHYERDRHRRFGMRYEREHDKKEQPKITPNKIDRRETSPRRAPVEIDRNFNRNYTRHSTEQHWEEQEEPLSGRLDYREHHAHEEDRRKSADGRRYDSPFNERRGGGTSREDRSRESRYVLQTTERSSFEDHRHHHHHHHRHPIYTGEKIRAAGTGIRDDNAPKDDWDAHHRDVEHGRERGYAQADWEEREWRARPMWDNRESLPRSEQHEEEWGVRYDSPITDWKVNDNRKWENQPVHIRGHFRNERNKDMDVGEHPPHGGKRRSFNATDSREECLPIAAKQTAIYGSMKDEPINKKLMELAEGRLRTSRERSADNFKKKIPPPREKSEAKETVVTDPKRLCVEEPLQAIHTESDLSDISDDPDDILNMEEEIADMEANKSRSSKTPDSGMKESQSAVQDSIQSSPKESMDEIVNTKTKDNGETIAFRSIEDENMETMDFEEISDGELEEDIKTSGKGLGDALGVDWESLVNEMQLHRHINGNQQSAQNRWQCKAIFQRIGISIKYAGDEFVEKLTKKCTENGEREFLLDNVALMHTALARSKLLEEMKNGLLNTVDDLLYRNNTLDNNENVEDDPALWKPCTALYEEAKRLFEQAV